MNLAHVVADLAIQWSHGGVIYRSTDQICNRRIVPKQLALRPEYFVPFTSLAGRFRLTTTRSRPIAVGSPLPRRKRG